MYISQGSNLGFCEPHPSPSLHIKNKRERWDELTTYAGAGGSLGPLQSVGRRVDGPIGCWGHLSCSQLGRPLSPPLPSLCQLHWPPSRGKPERLLQAVSLGGRHGMPWGGFCFLLLVLSQPREPSGQVSEERGAERQASRQQFAVSEPSQCTRPWFLSP